MRAGAISRVSFLDLFEPIDGATNHITWHIYVEFQPENVLLEATIFHV